MFERSQLVSAPADIEDSLGESKEAGFKVILKNEVLSFEL